MDERLTEIELKQLQSILEPRDSYLLDQILSGGKLSLAQRAILSDHMGDAVMDSLGLEWETTSESLEIEVLSRRLSYLFPVEPAPSIRGGVTPVESRSSPTRYDVYGEVAPSDHEVQPLAPQAGSAYSPAFKARALAIYESRPLDETEAKNVLGVGLAVLKAWQRDSD